MFCAEEPERLRGPQHDAAWFDELAAMARWLVTTTPKPVPLLRDLLTREGRDIVVTRGSTYDNAANLAPAFLDAIRAPYENTRIGRQEINAELLLDTPGALWTRTMLEGASFKGALPDMARVIVAVDPSGTSGTDDGDSVGIVICGKGLDGLYYVLGD
jgi:phage terminase large subunit-like protein